jgi:hypothetical protein
MPQTYPRFSPKTLYRACWAGLLALCLCLPPAQAQTAEGSASEASATYSGRKRKGIPHGYGTCQWPDGKRYKGFWKEGAMSGQGTMTYPNGDVYVGSWENGLKHGIGQYTWKNGDFYYGGYEQGIRTGRGRLELANGGVYEGAWRQDQANGEGTFEWAEGNVYIGQWKDNLPHGQGTMTYADGSVAQGEWVEGQYQACSCELPETPMEAYGQADAVVAAKVVQIEPGPLAGTSMVTLDVQEYWKGQMGLGTKLRVASGRTSCDFIYFQDAEYLLFLKKGPQGYYFADRCSRSGELFFKQYDVEQLRALAPCEAEPSAYQAPGGYDAVCGCDGKTYTTPGEAARQGIGQWKKGACP